VADICHPHPWTWTLAFGHHEDRKHACTLVCEDIVSKRRGTCYCSGHSRDWDRLNQRGWVVKAWRD